MEFREWLLWEAGYGPVTDPYEALQLLGLDDYSGKRLDDTILSSAYRIAARKTHPDSGGDKEEFQKVAAAYEILRAFADSGQTLPTTPGQTRAHTGFGSGFGTRPPAPNVPTRDRPEEAPVYSEADLKQWAEQVAAKGFVQVIQKEKKDTLGAMGHWQYPMGSKVRTWKLSRFGNDNPEGIITTVRDIMRQARVEEPWADKVVQINIYDAYAFINFIWPLSEDAIEHNKRTAAHLSRLFGREYKADTFGYCTIEFNAPPKPKKKGGGMKANAVSEYLANNGLRYVGGGGKNTYYGLTAHQEGKTPLGYVVKLQKAVFKCVYRYRYTGGYRSEIREVEKFSKPYGQLTPEILDKVIEWVKAMYEKHGLGEDRD